MENTDKEWERFGAHDPYYGVLADDKFRSSKLNDLSLSEFFKSGADYVDDLFTLIKKYFNQSQNPKNILDFGCGVGRLVIPFSKRSESVVGIDVSASMLNEATNNCAKRSITNVQFIRSNDDLTEVTKRFDLIHSVIVFQHIPVPRGEKIVHRLIDLLESGGIGVLHFTYARIGYVQRRIKIPSFIKRIIPGYDIVRKLYKGIALSNPEMQMNCYDINRLLQIFQINSIHEVHVRFMKHQPYLGVTMFFKKEL